MGAGHSRSRASRSGQPISWAVLLALVVASPASAQYEGYGSISVGGAGGDVYRVTSLADSGPGTLREGVDNRSGARTIVFDVGGTITLQSDISIDEPFLTIDGSTAPSPGITLTQNTVFDGLIIKGTHDIIISHIRFTGLWTGGQPTPNGAETITIDGDAAPDSVAQRIVLDHITSSGSADEGPDLWGEIRDVTISWCLFYRNWHPITISHSGSQVRQRISMHHNVYAQNQERTPQIRNDVRDFDFVNNIIYDWSFYVSFGYGVRIRAVAGEADVNGNFVNNAFVPGSGLGSWALVYGINPGPDAEDGGPSGLPPPQGTLVTTSEMGDLWVAGNILPVENADQYSTVASPIPVPPAAQVTTSLASELGALLLPSVGMLFRDFTEQAILDDIASAGVFPLMVSIGDVTVTEGDVGTVNANFPVTLSGTSGSAVTVDWTTANGTAVAGSDFVAASDTLIVVAGSSGGTITVAVSGDTEVEPDETFLVNLTAVSGATIADGQGEGTISDDDSSGTPIFADGFESGNTSLWSSAVP